jgi:hypothetical protein
MKVNINRAPLSACCCAFLDQVRLSPLARSTPAPEYEFIVIIP